MPLALTGSPQDIFKQKKTQMTPKTEAELAEAIAGADGPLRVMGGGTRDVGRPVDGVPLRVGLSGVKLYEPGALTLVVAAGTPLAEVEALLAGEGQRLAFEPMDHRALLGTDGAPTIGGVVAGNISGPRRVQVGACRDFLLGVRFVDGRGQVLVNGGRVMKNVTGYDLARLMAGSWGTLGVLSEVSLKVLAAPEAEATLVAGGLEAGAGVALMSRALGTPYDVSGAALVGGQVRLRLEGFGDSVTYRAAALGTALGGDWEVVEGDASAALWRDVRDAMPFAGRKGAVWRLSVKPTDGPVLVAALAAQGRRLEALHDWGGGLVWLLVEEAGDACAGAIRGEIARLGGHATLLRANAETRARLAVFQPQPAPLAAITARIKQEFDPRGILNPGLMGV